MTLIPSLLIPTVDASASRLLTDGDIAKAGGATDFFAVLSALQKESVLSAMPPDETAPSEGADSSLESAQVETPEGEEESVEFSEPDSSSEGREDSTVVEGGEDRFALGHWMAKNNAVQAKRVETLPQSAPELAGPFDDAGTVDKSVETTEQAKFQGLPLAQPTSVPFATPRPVINQSTTEDPLQPRSPAFVETVLPRGGFHTPSLDPAQRVALPPAATDFPHKENAAIQAPLARPFDPPSRAFLRQTDTQIHSQNRVFSLNQTALAGLQAPSGDAAVPLVTASPIQQGSSPPVSPSTPVVGAGSDTRQDNVYGFVLPDATLAIGASPKPPLPALQDIPHTREGPLAAKNSGGQSVAQVPELPLPVADAMTKVVQAEALARPAVQKPLLHSASTHPAPQTMAAPTWHSVEPAARHEPSNTHNASPLPAPSVTQGAAPQSLAVHDRSAPLSPPVVASISNTRREWQTSNDGPIKAAPVLTTPWSGTDANQAYGVAKFAGVSVTQNQTLTAPNSAISEPVEPLSGGFGITPERMEKLWVSQPTQPATPERNAAFARHVTAQIVEAMGSAQTRSIDIRLDPEELGRVHLNLRHADGQMSVAITAERPETLELLRRHIDQLAQDVRALGYGTLRFDFHHGHQRQNQSGPETLAQSSESRDEVVQSVAAPSPTPRATGAGLDLRL